MPFFFYYLSFLPPFYYKIYCINDNKSNKRRWIYINISFEIGGIRTEGLNIKEK
jgi:hypothetical protein